jgi:hypothetical protein
MGCLSDAALQGVGRFLAWRSGSAHGTAQRALIDADADVAPMCQRPRRSVRRRPNTGGANRDYACGAGGCSCGCGCDSRKNRTISADASGPLASV